MADFGLTDSVNTTESLLEAIGVPWQVIINHEMRPLQVNTLARCISRHKNHDILVLDK